MEEAFKFASTVASCGKFDLVILDEIFVALDKKLLDVNSILELISKKSPVTELILTGRGAPKEIIEVSDLVTEMKEVKHPINKKIRGREGVDY